MAKILCRKKELSSSDVTSLNDATECCSLQFAEEMNNKETTHKNIIFVIPFIFIRRRDCNTKNIHAALGEKEKRMIRSHGNFYISI